MLGLRRHEGKRQAHDYLPCVHEGPCTPQNCTCRQAGRFCEKFCGCTLACRARFPGCRCHTSEKTAVSGCCQTLACPCFAAYRECDPDLCGDCGARARIGERNARAAATAAAGGGAAVASSAAAAAAAAADGDEAVLQALAAQSDEAVLARLCERKGHCKNCNTQDGTHRRVLVSQSVIHGWGAYLLEGCEKNEFIYEYMGELVSQVRV